MLPCLSRREKKTGSIRGCQGGTGNPDARRRKKNMQKLPRGRVSKERVLALKEGGMRFGA